MNHTSFWRLSVLLAVCLLFLTSCGKQDGADQLQPSLFPYEPGQTHVLVPDAPGTDTTRTAPLTLDFSHSDQGYFMGKLDKGGAKINIQLTGPDGIIYKYFLNDEEVWTSFPFTAGNGAYVLVAFEEISDGQYASLLSYSLSVELENEFLPFIYPNQFVDFEPDDSAIQLAAELSTGAATDLDALSAIYEYVTTHVSYDDEKAATVEAGYLPNIEDTLQTGKGICFDYASLTAAMLRSLGIPTRLDIGYSGEIRHAWVDVYIESMGWVERAVEFNGEEWKLIDPTIAATNDNSEAISNYVGDGSNYTLQYVR